MWIMSGCSGDLFVGRSGSALALVQLLHGQTGEGEDADADQDQQGGEESLKHGVLLGERWAVWGPGPSLMGGAPAPACEVRR
ncbi:hypothetical protein GCM10023237_36280 [Streptomyces coeruleoprunus]